MATMEDVARIAGVSTSTVSHVLNGTRKVSPDTVQAVQSAIRQLGYIPNTLARSLARSTTNTIGVAISVYDGFVPGRPTSVGVGNGKADARDGAGV